MRLGIKGWFLIMVAAVLAGLIWWDHSFQSAGWVPSLGANLITMVGTVVILDSLLRRRQKQAAAVLLRTSFLNIGVGLSHVADTLVDNPDGKSAEFWYGHIIEEWKSRREGLERDLTYCANDLDPDLREKIKALEEKVRHYGNMGWGDYRGEQLIVGKDVLAAWGILREIQQALYPQDSNMRTIFDQVQERMDAMVEKFKPDW